MDDNTEKPSPEPAEPAPQTDAEPALAPQTKPRFRDRVLGMRGVAAVAVASVILGGAGGAALGAASGGDDNDQQRGRPGMNNGQFPGGPGDGRGNSDNRQMLPPNGNPIPPTTAPQDEDS